MDFFPWEQPECPNAPYGEPQPLRRSLQLLAHQLGHEHVALAILHRHNLLGGMWSRRSLWVARLSGEAAY